MTAIFFFGILLHFITSFIRSSILRVNENKIVKQTIHVLSFYILSERDRLFFLIRRIHAMVDKNSSGSLIADNEFSTSVSTCLIAR